MKKILVASFLLFSSQWLWAANAVNFPAGCKPVNFQFKKQLLQLNTQAVKTPQVFLFQNISGNDFWFNHPVKYASASAGWNSFIHANHWTAFLVTQPNFAISCSQMVPGSVQPLSCQKVIQVCALQNVKNNAKLNGNFWLAEDQPLDALLAKIKKRGISY